MFIHGEGELLVPAHLNYGKFILDRLRNVNSDDTCLVNRDTDEKLTYGEFAAHAVRLSASLSALGARRGRTVAVAGEPRAAFLPTTLAVMLTGAAYTPIELECGRTVLAQKFNLTRPEYIICSRLFWEGYCDILKGFDFIKTFICFDDIDDIELSVASLVSRSRHVDVDAFEPIVVSGEDAAMVVYSSGTTGVSKGVVLTHLNCIVRTDIKWYNGVESVHAVFIIAELCSTYIIFLINYFLITGKMVICSEKPVDLKTLQDYRVNTMATVPAALEELLNAVKPEEYDLSSLQSVYCAAGPVHPTQAKLLHERYPHLKLLRLYGATELDVLTVQSPSDTDTATVGVPVPGVTFKVVDVETRAILGPNQRGEICARTPAMMKGYLGSGSRYLDEEGFYLTGDLGYYDDVKRFYLVGRLKDVISYLGFKVSPVEVEAVLMRHPAVREAAVVGKPAGARGEAPAAFVVLHSGMNVTEAELVEYVDKEVTWYMRLTGGVRFVPNLPRTGLGKVLRRRLREMLELE